MRVAGLIGVLLLLQGPLQDLGAQGIPGVAPLFQDVEPVQLRIEADFKSLRGDRGDRRGEREARLIVVEDDGTETALPLKVRTRGRFRLERSTCAFPPLRLNVPKSRVEGTLFEGQDKLKLVTHCRDRDEFEQNTLREYLVYRFYNLLTPLSFQVRLARITYLDTEGRDETRERWGFVIESERAVADRLGGSLVPDDGQMVHPARMRGEDTGRVTLFQYLVGNTDFSMYYGHNVAAVEMDQSRVIPVPYDFDFAGVVDARYAKPAPELGTRSVRERVYRGVCRPDVDHNAMKALLLGHRDSMTALVQSQVGLQADEARDVLEYLDEAWETLQRPDDARREIAESCRPV